MGEKRMYIWAGFRIEAGYMGSGWRFGEPVALFAQLDFGYHPGCQMCVRVRRDVPLWKGNIKCSAMAMRTDVDMRSYVGIMLSQLTKLHREFKSSPCLSVE